MSKTLADIAPPVKGALDSFLREILYRQSDNVLRVVLFGSFARGDDDDNSDIDVFLMLKRDSMKEENDVVDSSYSADLSSNFKTYIAPFTMSEERYLEGAKYGFPIVKNIEREGVVLYDATK